MTTQRLVTFLYLLLRDELVAGKVEALVRQAERDSGLTFEDSQLLEYSNLPLAQYAKQVASRLGEPVCPYVVGDWVEWQGQEGTVRRQVREITEPQPGNFVLHCAMEFADKSLFPINARQVQRVELGK